MRLRYLTLANYRGLKDKKIDLSGDKVSIYGQNGAGKTTVANAIMDVLTDGPATSEKDYSPKTAGAHQMNHIVALTVVKDDGEEVVYRKDFHEIWKKKRGAATAEFSGHETDYEADGIPMKKKDFGEAMISLCGGDSEQTRMLMLPNYFAEELSADKRRKILVDICGDISDDEILNLSGIAPLREYLPIPGTSGKNYSPEDFLPIAKAKRRDLNKKLDEYPARIDELTRTLGETIDIDEAKEKLRKLDEEKRNRLAVPRDTTILGMEAAIVGIKTAIEKGREAWLKSNNADIDSKLEQMRLEKLRLVEERSNINMTLLNQLDNLQKLKDKREKLLTDFEQLKQERWNPKSEICPTCGQTLPVDTVRQLREKWLENLAERKAEINAQGKTCSLSKIEAVESMATAYKNKLDALDADIDSLSAEMSSLARQKPSSEYESTEKYKENKLRLDELQEKLAQAKAEKPDEKPDTSDIDAQIDALNEQIARQQASESARQRIEELQAEMKETSANLDYYDKGIHLCEMFFKAKMEYVSQKVADRFETVGFRLFKEQINGGLAECCEPLIRNSKGTFVEWKSANTSGQINAGLEIIEALSKHYNVNLPVLVDRAESVTNLREMPGHQVIRFVVSKDDAELYIVNE